MHAAPRRQLHELARRDPEVEIMEHLTLLALERALAEARRSIRSVNDETPVVVDCDTKHGSTEYPALPTIDIIDGVIVIKIEDYECDC